MFLVDLTKYPDPIDFINFWNIKPAIWDQMSKIGLKGWSTERSDEESWSWLNSEKESGGPTNDGPFMN